MADKKVVIFIVEGVSDERVIAAIRNYVPGSCRVYIHITRGDLFTKPGVRKNIKVRVADQVKKVMNATKFRKREILAVVQLTDMDGTFVRDQDVMIDSAVGKDPNYREDGIVVRNAGIRQYIQKRNREKASELRAMCASAEIMAGIYYFLFYFSCNLDHVMHNNRNMPVEEKIRRSRDFEHSCRAHPEHFYHFFHDQPFAVQGSIDETWRFIEQGNHSVQRYSNFHLIFDVLSQLESAGG
ncbi:hypothetical protein M3N64_12235 [Sporolactobacillus sp. CPB3-1]|uniref:DUF4276 family protein n=1 Tax=Sporolactobacillus mangiferae TaxID=2940498 RepID=A0ABT0MCS8_9BACL|nr:hypothetical protein [Sporolactobacillus mangiferae]MCL1632687.1 hypothetical protein [Sporolactobacillus mangiferae]